MTKSGQVYIIAEAGVNHNGSLDLAIQLVNAAAKAGADAVKFQTFHSESVISRFAPKAEYQKKTTGAEESQLEMVKKLELSGEAHFQLLAHAKSLKIDFLSTPFDSKSIDLLIDHMRLDRIKIPSGEITNAPYLLQIAKSGLPVIMSTGMGTLSDVERALGVLAFGYLNKNENPSLEGFQNAYFSEKGRQLLKERVVLLHATTEYPAPFESVNLRALDTLSAAFQLPVGLSDHTPGILMPIAAVARGAVLIEKHFTLDRNLPGPDHLASLEPTELTEMVQGIRQVEQALGTGYKIPAPTETKNRPIARKSLVARRPIQAGELFTEDNITAKRPGTGISPFEFWNLLGTPAKQDYQEDERI